MVKGRIIEIYGPESSGKTTLALHILAEAQKRGGEVAFVDAEHALDPVYAAALGVDTDNLLVSQPDTGEQALEKTIFLAIAVFGIFNSEGRVVFNNLNSILLIPSLTAAARMDSTDLAV